MNWITSLMGEDLLFAGVAVAFITAVFVARRFSGAPFRLHQWAQEHDYTIIRSKYRSFASGPFDVCSRHIGQDIYQICVLTSEGRERNAWIRCSYSDGGEPVAVVWDD